MHSCCASGMLLRLVAASASDHQQLIELPASVHRRASDMCLRCTQPGLPTVHLSVAKICSSYFHYRALAQCFGRKELFLSTLFQETPQDLPEVHPIRRSQRSKHLTHFQRSLRRLRKSLFLSYLQVQHWPGGRPGDSRARRQRFDFHRWSRIDLCPRTLADALDRVPEPIQHLRCLAHLTIGRCGSVIDLNPLPLQQGAALSLPSALEFG